MVASVRPGSSYWQPHHTHIHTHFTHSDNHDGEEKEQGRRARRGKGTPDYDRLPGRVYRDCRSEMIFPWTCSIATPSRIMPVSTPVRVAEDSESCGFYPSAQTHTHTRTPLDSVKNHMKRARRRTPLFAIRDLWKRTTNLSGEKWQHQARMRNLLMDHELAVKGRKDKQDAPPRKCPYFKIPRGRLGSSGPGSTA